MKTFLLICGFALTLLILSACAKGDISSFTLSFCKSTKPYTCEVTCQDETQFFPVSESDHDIDSDCGYECRHVKAGTFQVTYYSAEGLKDDDVRKELTEILGACAE